MDKTDVTRAVEDYVVAATRDHVRGEQTAPLYLATGRTSSATAILAAAEAHLRAAGCGGHLLTCPGEDFVHLWHDTLRRGMTPFVRRALAAKRVVLIDGVEALRDKPFAQAELARLITPGRLVILAGGSHLRHIAAWSPALRTPLAGAASLCLHAGPCCSDEDVWGIVGLVAAHYGVTPAVLLSRRRTGPVALARQAAIYLLHEQGLSYAEVGRILRRHHSTVLYGYARILQLRAQKVAVRNDLAELGRRACTA